MMRAVGFTEFGGPQVLRLVSLPVPAPGPGQVLGVTGAAGAVGGYAIQLGRAEGLRVIADASPADEDLVSELGAHEVVPRGPGVAGRMRQVFPSGVDALLDAAVMGAPVLAAVRDGGKVVAVRPFSGETERGIWSTWTPSCRTMATRSTPSAAWGAAAA